MSDAPKDRTSLSRFNYFKEETDTERKKRIAKGEARVLTAFGWVSTKYPRLIKTLSAAGSVAAIVLARKYLRSAHMLKEPGLLDKPDEAVGSLEQLSKAVSAVADELPATAKSVAVDFSDAVAEAISAVKDLFA